MEPVRIVCHCTGLSQKACVFMVRSSNMARTLTCLYGDTIFQVLRSLLVFGTASLMGKKVSRCSQSALCATTLGSKCGMTNYRISSGRHASDCIDTHWTTSTSAPNSTTSTRQKKGRGMKLQFHGMNIGQTTPGKVSKQMDSCGLKTFLFRQSYPSILF